MELCSNTHHEIIHDLYKCPICEQIEELNDAYIELNKEKVEIEKNYEELDEKYYDLTEQYDNLRSYCLENAPDALI